MTIYDLRGFAILLGICAVSTIGAVLIIDKFRHNWSHRKIVLISAAPLPAILFALCLFIFIETTYFSSEEECGIDGCGMAIMAATILLISIVIIYPICLAVAEVFCKFTRR